MTESRMLICMMLFNLLFRTNEIIAQSVNTTDFKPSLTLGILNDNLPCSYEAAMKGWSAGPDDQYTFTLFSQMELESWFFRVSDNAVTSRVKSWRFDMLKISAGKRFKYGFAGLTPYAGILLSGNYGGEVMQNKVHVIAGYPEVEFPYMDYTYSANFGLNSEIELPLFPVEQIHVSTFFDIDAYLGFGPNMLRLGLETVFEIPFVSAELVSGISTRFFLPEKLDFLLKSGLFSFLLITMKPIKDFKISLGAGVFPVGTVDDDLIFFQINYKVMPQFCLMMTFGENHLSSRAFPFP